METNLEINMPEFTAHELNHLDVLGRTHPDYVDARKLALYGKGLSERQVNWLWAIKRDLGRGVI